MSIKDCHIKQLYALREIIHTKSVSEAAKNLSLTQSSISSLLQKIRYILNDQIIVRAGNDMLLTPYAIKIEAPLNKLISSIDTLFQKMSHFEPEALPSHFTIAISTSFEHLYLPELLKKLKQYPLMTIEVITNIELNTKNIDQYKECDIDFFLFQNIALPKCENIPIFSSDICLVTNAQKVFDKNNFDIETYFKLPHIDVKKPAEIFNFEQHFSIEDKRNVIITTDTIYTCLNIIASQKELTATLPIDWVNSYNKYRDLPLKFIPLPFLNKKENNYIAWPIDKAVSPKNIWMREVLFDLLKVTEPNQTNQYGYKM